MSKQRRAAFRGKLSEWTMIAIMGLILGSMLWLPGVLYFMGYGV